MASFDIWTDECAICETFVAGLKSTRSQSDLQDEDVKFTWSFRGRLPDLPALTKSGHDEMRMLCILGKQALLQSCIIAPRRNGGPRRYNNQMGLLPSPILPRPEDRRVVDLTLSRYRLRAGIAVIDYDG